MYAADALARIAAGLAGPGWAAHPAALDPALPRALLAEAEALWRDEEMRPAAIGRGEERAVRRTIRGDRIRWLDPRTATPPQAELFAAVEQLRLYLNRELTLGLWDVELQIAGYAPGARYHRHVDVFEEVRLRRITVLLYLNRDWDEACGGALRLYGPDGPVDVLPRENTLLCFLSAAIEHEVLPATRMRFSVGGWFRRREIGP